LILRKAGLREIRVHDVRHTYASLLLSDGASLVYVKEQMGHSSIQMTVDIYGHLIPSSNRAAVNRLDGRINPQVAATQAQPGKNEKGITIENQDLPAYSARRSYSAQAPSRSMY